ncbi:hypothetical protein [Colwellia sp. MEBiC06753]
MFKVASVYLITTWLILQIVAVVSPALHLPTLFSTIVTLVLAMGFPVACIFAWAFELTPEGIKRSYQVDRDESIASETGQKINYLLAFSLALALSFIAYQQWAVVEADDSLERSIAVLPFEDMSPDKSQGYFGDGIAEEILNSLARLNQLVVIARTSSFNFKRSNADIKEIGEKLQVNYILEGSVRKDNDMVRITAQLIEVASGAHIWSQTYDRELINIFSLQDELTFAITQALKLNLLPEQVALEAGMTTEPQAYDLFIKARALQYQRSAETIKQAVELLEQALAIDPNFHLARAQLYMSYSFANDYGGFTFEQQKQAKKSLFYQLLTAPDFPLKHLAFADYLSDKGEFKVAQALYTKAYELAPNDPLIQNIYLLQINDIEKIIAERNKIIRTNPDSIINYHNLNTLYVAKGDLEQAYRVLKLLEDKAPEDAIANYSMMYYSIEHQPQKTIDYLAQYQGKPVEYHSLILAVLFLLLGDIDAGINALAQEFKHFPESKKWCNEVFILMSEYKQQGLLTDEQITQFNQLGFTETQKQHALALQGLLQGDEQIFAKQFNIENNTPAEFLDKTKDIPYEYEALLYAAIKKQQGDNRFAEALLPAIRINLLKCEAVAYGGGNREICLLYMYLAGNYSPQQFLNTFKRSLTRLNFSVIGIERFIFSSPIYYGVKQHPEFKALANDMLDNTFRKWNPKLIDHALNNEHALSQVAVK